MCLNLVSTPGIEFQKVKINPESCDLQEEVENDETFYDFAAHQTLFLKEFTTATSGLKFFSACDVWGQIRIILSE